MKKYKFKKEGIFIISGTIFIALATLLGTIDSTTTFKEDADDYKYINKTIFKTEEQTVMSVNDTIVKPFKNEKVTKLKSYYDHNATAEEQEKALIYFESTYMQSNAIAYGAKEDFEVTLILDGTVKKIKEDKLVGTVIEVDHGNGILGIYQSLKDIKVKENDILKQGDIIGMSSVSNLNKDLGTHVLFELIIDNKIVNPEQYFDKKVNDIK